MVGRGPRLEKAISLQGRIDALRAERGTRFPRKPGKKASWRSRELGRRIARLSAKAARIRREALHEWTTQVAALAQQIAIVAPPVKATTKSARGTERNPGAAVETVAKVNRHVLAQAPSSAAQMLAYKAAEAGATVRECADEAPAVAISRDIQKSAKAVRRLKRAIKKAA